MSKLFKILISLVICLSCTALFACGGFSESEPTSEKESVSESESVLQSVIEPDTESEEESEEEVESDFIIELPEVPRN